MERFILASASPRRRRLLAEAGYDFEVVPPPVEEPRSLSDGLMPSRQAEALAYFKARSVAERARRAVVLGADTVVAASGKILGKAADEAEARAMLDELAGIRHAVITGVTLLRPGGKRTMTSVLTWVTMRPMSREEIDAYVASGEWVGKAGAYAIQESADRYVERVEGSWTNVVGLPMERVTRLLGPAES